MENASLMSTASKVKAMVPCSFGGCMEPFQSKLLCKRHYDQKRSGGSLRPLKPIPPPPTARNESGEKWCPTHGGWTSIDLFSKGGSRADGLQSRCKKCRAAHYKQNSTAVRASIRLNKYGLTERQFQDILESQDGKCEGCQTQDPGRTYWHVDHDHACCTGKKSCGKCVRGVLCSNCNTALGFMKDNPQTAKNLSSYLQKWGK